MISNFLKMLSRSRFALSTVTTAARMGPIESSPPSIVSLRRYCAENKKESDAETEKLEKPPSPFFTRKEYMGGRIYFSWFNFVSTSIGGAMLYIAYLFIKAKKDAALEKERKREIGKTMIGGTFELLDHTGKTVTDADFKGKWILLYFGFTHCPDICPDEMEKMAEVVDKLEAERKKMKGVDEEILPLFISVDPERDGVKEVAEYIKEFHPRMVGLTGTQEQVLKACKAYRVYFSAGPRDEEMDYIVDHTIIIYLINPDGEFLDYYGQTKDATQITFSVLMQMKKFYDLQGRSLMQRLVQ